MNRTAIAKSETPRLNIRGDSNPISQLPDICTYRFFRQGGCEAPAVVSDMKCFCKIAGIGDHQHDLSIGSKKCDVVELIQLGRSDTQGTRSHKLCKVGGSVVCHVKTCVIPVESDRSEATGASA